MPFAAAADFSCRPFHLRRFGRAVRVGRAARNDRVRIAPGRNVARNVCRNAGDRSLRDALLNALRQTLREALRAARYSSAGIGPTCSRRRRAEEFDPMAEAERRILDDQFVRGDRDHPEASADDVAEPGGEFGRSALFAEHGRVVIRMPAGDHADVLKLRPRRSLDGEQELIRIKLAVRRLDNYLPRAFAGDHICGHLGDQPLRADEGGRQRALA